MQLESRTDPPQASLSRPKDLRALVARVWTETLGIAPIEGVTLFMQGADSLLATRLATRLGEALDAKVPVCIVLKHPTLDGLAEALEDCEQRSTPLRRPAPPSSPLVESTLSFSQERMWFMHAIAPQSIAYNISLALRLRGPLDVAAMRQALDQVVARHAVLRSNYVSRANGVVAVLRPVRPSLLAEVRLPQTDDPSLADLQLREYLGRVVNRPFDLANDPLLRAEIVHVADNDALLLLLVHHIAGDEWSFDLFARELAAYYNALTSGATLLEPPPVELEYSDYATWHRQWFRREREPFELAYWQEQLAGLEPVTFTADRLRPPQQSFRGRRLHRRFEPALADRLREVGATADATLAMVLLAALKALLHRHAGATDIGIGVPIANRHHPGAESVFGTLLNTLVLRTDLGGDPAFSSLLEQVRDNSLAAYEHQDMPFEQLVQALQLPRDPSRAPLFGVMFNMLNTPLGELEFDGLSWSRFEFDRRAAQFDLTVTVDAQHDCSIVFEYATDLYAPATMERIADQYFDFLEAIAASPDTRLSELPAISAADRTQLLDWGTGPRRQLHSETLARLLEPAFARHERRTAVVCGRETLDYGDLGWRADTLARQLRARGLGRGSRIGICLQRSTRTLVSLLGVMRAGAAWVPLDSSYPAERLEFMARDAGLDLLITETALVGCIAWPEEATLWYDQPLSRDDAGDPVPWDPLLDARPEDPAYVIYTSGSTGRPKGVVVPHRAVCNFLISMARKPGLGPRDRLLAVTTLSFDIAVLEMLLPLAVGARLVLAERADLTDGQSLRKLAVRHGVNVMQATPSTWRMLLDADWQGAQRFRALVGGESLAPGLAAILRARCAEVWNMYGPTETTVWSSCWRVDESASGGRISLGTPIDNTQIHVLDAYGQLCPIGVPGELCIGGEGLATGYHGRPELDSDRFVPNPFSEERDARLYRTGDRARWLEDGSLQHLGRLDFQVKIRGHRIELGEIEARLALHPELAGSVVIAREDRPGDVRLVAYSVPWDTMPEPAELRDFLREKLPEYMVPQHFVELDAIPLLPNGKLDRAGLPAASAHLVSGKQVLPPRNMGERQLWLLWRDVLGIDHFGVEDDFFDLGGHSMLAVRLVGRIRESLDAHCTLPMLFRHPTIKRLAKAMETSDAEVVESALVPLQPLGERAPLFCLCGIQLYGSLAAQFAPERPVYGVFVAEELAYVDGSDNTACGPANVTDLATRYLEVIRSHQPNGPYHLVGFSFGGVLAFEIAQQLRAAGEVVGLLAIIDSDVPGDARYRLPFRLRRAISRLLNPPAIAATQSDLAVTQDSEPLSNVVTERNHGYLAAMRDYRAKPYDGDAVFIEATHDGEHTAFGWDRLVKRLDVHRLPADHLGVLQPEMASHLALILKRHVG